MTTNTKTMPTCLHALLPKPGGFGHGSQPRGVPWWVGRPLVRKTGNGTLSSSGIFDGQSLRVATLYCASIDNVTCISNVISC